MENDKFQDKYYRQIFQELKEEKMNWDFEDFLKKTEEFSSETEKIIPIHKKSGNTQKWYWLAASSVAFFGLIISHYIQMNYNANPVIAQNNNQPKSQKINTNIKSEENLPLIRKIDTEIFPKKKKSKYKNRAQYLAVYHHKSTYKHQNSAPIEVEQVEYNPNFVVINGKPVATEEEAINYTKTALEMFGGNINATLENAEPVKLLTVNF